jgi:hypothetical protein
VYWLASTRICASGACTSLPCCKTVVAPAQAQTKPEEVGMLLAPPGAALLLIVSFLIYRVTIGKEEYEP